MRYLVTFVPISPRTRRRTGKASTEVIDTTAAPWSEMQITDPAKMEKVYEAARDVKVVDVREAT